MGSVSIGSLEHRSSGRKTNQAGSHSRMWAVAWLLESLASERGRQQESLRGARAAG